MSIPAGIHAAALANVAVSPELLLIALVAASMVIGVAAGVLPPRAVSGPDRVPFDRPAWPLLGVVFGALGFYLLSASLYAMLRHPAGSSATTRPQLDSFDMAFVSAVPPLIGFFMLLAGGQVLGRSGGVDLGLGTGNLLEGVSRGALGTVIVVPPLFLVEQAVELAYRQLQYQHPTEHPLLHVLGEQPGTTVKVMLIGGACVVAPLFEETLFRGYIQTLLRRMVSHLTTPAPQPVSITAEAVATVPGAPPRPTAWQTWIAIGLTSAFFALVHPAWSQPVIFVLSVCLGYAYERTRNLWVPIVIHALFNAASTALFLLSASS